ncbi:hypothetical protein RF11_14737 [Thelohanellus kitauei]|uniref:Uncharacterized protein n=1 Tax=Thelohanellus kitauei TaxID=669202 RepID=A0A0C2MGJ5_THEKT|nr:hypothetical protein RF11_14737 [Thelohanellus kitauei]
MERSIYRVTGTACKWIKSISDFEIKNIDSEVYDPNKTYSDEESKIIMFGSSVQPKHCVFQSLIGTLQQTTFNGRVVDQHAWAPIYLDQTRSAYANRRLRGAEMEICKARAFT